MNEVLESFKNFFTNEVVINWLAPIITGLIVVIITWVIKMFQNRNDERKIDDANQRFLNSIRPYVIQEISISSNFISDIRNVIAHESQVKEKFIYSELELRNKLIMDISENKYIDEKSKENLIKFTYKTFEHFDKSKGIKTEEITNKNIIYNILNQLINLPVLLFIFSMILMIIISLFDKKHTNIIDNPLFALPFLLGFASTIVIVVSIIFSAFESNVTKKRRSDYDINKDYIDNINIRDMAYKWYEKDKDKK